MNKIENKFAELRRENKLAFMPFMVAGDPSFDKSLLLIKKLVNHADLLELGFPFSDPLADDSTIQNANMRALNSGMTTAKVFSLIKKIRKFSDIPIITLVYSNLVLQQGMKNFYKNAAASGVNGVLVPDLPVEEAEIFLKYADQYKIDPIFLIAQTTNNSRLKKITKVAQGFLYVVNILGTTGERGKFEKETFSLLRKLKKYTRLPLAAGFGVSNANQFTKLKFAGADGVIVGSRLINNIKPQSMKKTLSSIKTDIKKLTSKSN